MIKQFFRTMLVSLTLLTGLFAQGQTISMTTDAPAGTRLRIYPAFNDDVTVIGADKTDEFGIYLSKGEGSAISLTGKITQLEVYGNQLTSLTIDGAKDLFILKCYNNKIASLDVSGCPELTNLDAQNNKLSTINLSANTKLESVNLNTNELVSAVAGALPSLAKLDLSHNQLSEIELDGCPALNTLKLNNNNFEYIDLSANTKVDWLQVFSNKIGQDEMDEFCETIAKPTGSSYYALYIVNTLDPEEGNRCSAANVAYLHDRKDWGVLDWCNGEIINGMQGKIYYGYDVAPTVNENHQVSLTSSRQAGETISLMVKSSGDLRFEGLKETVIVGADKALEYTLTSPNVIIYGDVTELDCHGNDLTALSFYGTPVITNLDCSDNKIEHLSIVNSSTLANISAQKNSLKTTTLQGCTGLGQVNIYDNALEGYAMANFMRSLPTATGGVLRIIDTESAGEKNIATTTDVKIATDKGWGVWDYYGGGNYGMGKRYEGSAPGEDNDQRYFAATTANATQVQIEVAGSNVSETQVPVVENATIAQWTGRAMQLNVTPGEEFKIYGDFDEIQGALCDLSSADISHLPGLKYFMMMGSSLSGLDLSSNLSLEIINVCDNELTTLDFSSCPALRQVLCYGNRISGSGMTDMINSLVTLTKADYGTITLYDAGYDAEQNLCLATDVNLAMSKWWAVYQLKNGEQVQYFGESTGLENIEADKAAPIYYNLQGIEVKTPVSGVYIERRGDATRKVIF